MFLSNKVAGIRTYGCKNLIIELIQETAMAAEPFLMQMKLHLKTLEYACK